MSNIDAQSELGTWPSIIFKQNFSIQEAHCRVCENIVPVSNYLVSPASVLFIEFDPMLSNLVTIHSAILLNWIRYELSGAFRNTGAHFALAVNTDHCWALIDDMKKATKFYNSFSDLKLSHPQGWFFCCYILESASLSLTNNDFCNERISSEYVLESMESQNSTLSYLNDHDYCLNFKDEHLSDHDYCMNNGRAVNKCDDKNRNESGYCSSAQLFNEHNYCVDSSLVKVCAIEQISPPKNSRMFSNSCRNEIKVPFVEQCPFIESNFNDNEFLSTKFPHRAQTIIKDFYSKLQSLKIFQCAICKEAWPSKVSYEICSRCKRNKKCPKKFSSENNMIPSVIPAELSNLSQAEERGSSIYECLL